MSTSRIFSTKEDHPGRKRFSHAVAIVALAAFAALSTLASPAQAQTKQANIVISTPAGRLWRLWRRVHRPHAGSQHPENPLPLLKKMAKGPHVMAAVVSRDGGGVPIARPLVVPCRTLSLRRHDSSKDAPQFPS
jgi:hypothetical protein